MYFKSRLLTFLCSVIAVLSLSSSVCAAEYSDRIEEISRQILNDEISLDKLTTNTHLRNEIFTINKTRRQFLWGIINSGATGAGLIDGTQLFFSTDHYVSGGRNAGQLYPQILGQEINAGGNCFELFNHLRIRLWAHKYGPDHSLHEASLLINRIDKNLAYRQSLLHTLPDSDPINSSLDAESKVLQDLRDILLTEYRRVYLKTRKTYTWANCMELTDLTRNIVGAVGNQISVKAGYTHNLHLNGNGNILSEISAIGITTRPIISLLATTATEYFAKNKLNKYLPGSSAGTTDHLEEDIKTLNSLTSKVPKLSLNNRSVFARARILNIESDLVPQQQLLAKRETTEFTKRIKLQMARNLTYGPTKMANSTLGIIAGYDPHLNIYDRNRLMGTGSLIYTTGQAFNFSELWREYLLNERQNYKQKERQLTEQQLLRSRLNTLNTMQNK